MMFRSFYVSILALTVGSFYGCDGRNNWEHLSTVKLDNNVYVEKFVNRGGVYSGNSVEYFLTDSSEYRFSIGICDDKEFFQIKVIDSKAIVEKHSRRNMKKKSSRIIETISYELPK